jgi:hypothetical protein
LRLSRAKLLKRLFGIDIQHCPNCSGQQNGTSIHRGLLQGALAVASTADLTDARQSIGGRAKVLPARCEQR